VNAIQSQPGREPNQAKGKEVRTIEREKENPKVRSHCHAQNLQSDRHGPVSLRDDGTGKEEVSN